jgi:hypothetical protein
VLLSELGLSPLEADRTQMLLSETLLSAFLTHRLEVRREQARRSHEISSRMSGVVQQIRQWLREDKKQR